MSDPERFVDRRSAFAGTTSYATRIILDGAEAAALLDANPDGLLVCDHDGIIVFVNNQLVELSGYHQSDLIGQSIELLIPHNSGERHRAHRQRYQAEPSFRPMGEGRDLTLRRENGSAVAVEISLAPFRLGAVAFTAAAVRDVTVRRAEDHARRRLLGMLDLVPAAIFVCQSDHHPFEYANATAASILGYSRDQLGKMTLRDIMLPAESNPGDLFDAPDLAPGRVTAPHEVQLRTSTDATIASEVRVARADGGDLSDPHFVVVAQDISERLAWSRRLETSEAAFRAVFEQAPVGVVVTAVDGALNRRVVRANEAFADFLGVPVEDLVGVSPAKLSPAEDDLLDLAATQAQISGAEPAYILEKRYRRGDGTFVWGELHSTLLSQPTQHDAQLRLSHVIDISARRAEADRRQRTERLRLSVGTLSLAMLRGSDADDVLLSAIQTLTDVLGADRATAFVRFGGSGDFRVSASIGEPPTTPALDDRSKGKKSSTQDSPTRVASPLTDGAEVAGWIWVGRAPGSECFSPVDVELFLDYVAQISTLCELAASRNTKQRLEVLEDRERIGRDLHDTVIQDLFAVGMQIDAWVSRITDEELQQRLIGVVDQLDATIRRIRGAVFDLHQPPKTVARPLTDELAATLREATRVLGYLPDVHVVGPINEVGPAIIEQMLPTLREALSNVARHAKASTTTVTLAMQQETVSLVVEDNGVGLDDSATPGSGTVNMLQRAAALGGTATLVNAHGGGTRLDWVVPLQVPI